MSSYKRVFALPRNLVAEEAPVCILGGALLYHTEQARFVAQLKMKNLSHKEISSVTVSLVEKNADGVAYREPIAFTYHAVAAAPEAHFGGRQAIPMTHKGVRAFAVTVSEVTFADGEKWDGTAVTFATAPKQEALRSTLAHDAQIGWRLRYGKRGVYSPMDLGTLWLCTCGTPNALGADTCSVCGADYATVLAPDTVALTAEGYTHRVKAEIAKSTPAAFAVASTMILDAPTGTDTDALTKELADARTAYAAKKLRKERTLKISLCIAIPAIVLAVAITLLTIFLFVPLGHYNKGMDYKDNGEYYDAYCEFIDANGFSTSQDWIEWIESEVTAKTIQLIREGNYTAARDLISPFKEMDSPAYKNLDYSYKATLFSGNGTGYSDAIWVTSDSFEYSGSSTRYYAFTPTSSGYYYFSSSISSGSYSFYGYLYSYDNSYYNLLASDPGYGAFSFNCYLTEGTTYYLKVSPSSYYTHATIYIYQN